MVDLANKDFGQTTDYIVTFPAGSTKQPVDIPIIDDNAFEFDETFKLEISIPKEAAIAGLTDGCDLITSSVTV